MFYISSGYADISGCLGGYACGECLTEPGQYSCSTLVLDMPIFQAALVVMHAGNVELNRYVLC